MKKPRNIVYGVDDIPPRGVLLLSGVQHVGLVAIFLLVPVIACRQAGMPPEKIIDVLSLSMLVMAVGPILHALRRGPVGSEGMPRQRLIAGSVSPFIRTESEPSVEPRCISVA